MAAKMADAVIEGMEMRQKEEIESKEFAPDTKSSEPSRVTIEEEIDDKDLLGEATLQKLAERKQTAEESIEETAEEVTEVIAEETAEEPVEEAAEESIEEVAEEAAEETASDEAPEETDSEDKSK